MPDEADARMRSQGTQKMPSNRIGSAAGEDAGKWVDILFYVGLAAIGGLAIFFRSQGYFDGSISFWWDEAHWAHRLLTEPLSAVIKIRPIGYMFLTKLLVTHISKDAVVFRSVSYISSILAIPILFFIGRRLWQSRAIILLLLFLAAFNPDLITFAKEFKPYALDFFVHASMIWLALIYIDSRKDSILYAILALSVISVFFCYNIVFIFPAIFLIFLLDAYSQKNYRRFALLVTAALVICLTLSLMYKFIWSGMSFAGQDKYWGNKYDVFFLGSSYLGHLKWLATKYAGLVRDAGHAEIFWSGFSRFLPELALLLLFLHGVGILDFILERRFDYLILFFLPIVTVILLNIIGLWPFGPFRVNLFLMVYFLILLVNGLSFFLKRKNQILKYGGYCVLFIFFFLLQLPINFNYYKIKPSDTWDPSQSNVRQVLNAIIGYEDAMKAKGYVASAQFPVFADDHAYFSTQFYLKDYWNAAAYRKSLHELNLHYYYVLSGVESLKIKGAYSILDMLRKLSPDPANSRGEAWIVLGYPAAVEKIGRIIDAMPERVIYKKKFSYASLVVLLRI